LPLLQVFTDKFSAKFDEGENLDFLDFRWKKF